jgi:hypothetical protein
VVRATEDVEGNEGVQRDALTARCVCPIPSSAGRLSSSFA